MPEITLKPSPSDTFDYELNATDYRLLLNILAEAGSSFPEYPIADLARKLEMQEYYALMQSADDYEVIHAEDNNGEAG